MKVKYKILYKNGVEDEIVQEESEGKLRSINEMIEQYLAEHAEGSLTLGDEISKGYYIRLTDITRVAIELL